MLCWMDKFCYSEPQVIGKFEDQENNGPLVLQLLHFCYIYSNVYKHKHTKVFRLPRTSAVALVNLQGYSFLAVG